MSAINKIQGISLIVAGIWNLISHSTSSLIVVTSVIGINALMELFR